MRSSRWQALPSGRATRASRRSPPAPSGTARPAIGVRHEPSSAASSARSQATAAAVGGSTSGCSSAATASSPTRHSMPSAPWPTAGSISSGASTVIAAVSCPRRLRPASASSVASAAPSASLRSRVPTLPRMGTTVTSGRRARSCARRRSDPVPTRAPAGRPARPPAASSGPSPCPSPALRRISTSRGSSRAGVQAISRPSGSQVGTSFIECTARSMRRSSSASSISLVNSPLPPMAASGRSVMRSPEVAMTCVSSAPSSASTGWAAMSRSQTWRVWAMASGLPRVPTVIGRRTSTRCFGAWSPLLHSGPAGRERFQAAQDRPARPERCGAAPRRLRLGA